METTVNLERIRPERVAGYSTNFVGEGWVERAKGQLLHDRNLRVTVTLEDDAARNMRDWILENRSAYPYSFTDARIIGVEIVQGQLVQSSQSR
jgi:hypothetical protein